jgi:hypothetical protein
MVAAWGGVALARGESRWCGRCGRCERAGRAVELGQSCAVDERGRAVARSSDVGGAAWNWSGGVDLQARMDRLYPVRTFSSPNFFCEYQSRPALAGGQAGFSRFGLFEKTGHAGYLLRRPALAGSDNFARAVCLWWWKLGTKILKSERIRRIRLRERKGR